MSGGRPHRLTYPNLRAIDRWFGQPKRNKSPPAKVFAHHLGVSISTLYNAAARRDAYKDVPPRRLSSGELPCSNS
jgi:hypothetical protein